MYSHISLPDGVSPSVTGVLFPIARTTQDDFRPVARRPAREITYLGRWGFTDLGIPLADRGNRR
ncbi:MAG TPA: hypothetical protein VHV82_09530 [Sporichthyaceae bacterium]|jgi:hypothetical protein|nr:hypothetical protein [Sporichthyaceae bacterium]